MVRKPTRIWDEENTQFEKNQRAEKIMSPVYRQIYDLIKKIPKGRVATYGQIARLAGIPQHARQVGYALNALPRELNVPWQRVINSKGEISARAETFFEQEQRKLLQKEGVVFNAKGRVSLERFQWKGKLPADGVSDDGY